MVSNRLDSNNLPRSICTSAAQDRMMNTSPIATMILKLQKTIATGGRSSAGTDFSPWTSPSRLWVRIRLPRYGIAISKWFFSAEESGSPNRTSGAPFFVSQCPSMAATLIGWCSRVFKPCRSPTTSWSGVATASMTTVIFSAMRQVPGTDRRDDEPAGDERSQGHVREAVRQRRVENRLQPRRYLEVAVDQFDAGRRMEPAVGRQDPERRDEGAQRHHAGGQQVQAARHLVASEQQHPEERGFEKECGHHFVAQHRAQEIRGCVRKIRPVGPELERHHDTGDNAQSEHQRKDLDPELAELLANRIRPAVVHCFQDGDISRQTDGEHRENRVERYNESELDSRQQKRIEFHVPGSTKQINNITAF